MPMEVDRFDPMSAPDQERKRTMRKETPSLANSGSSKLPTSAESDRADQSDKNKAESDVAIMLLAHEKWVAAGRPKGDGRRFWVEAERALRQGK